MNNLSVHGQYDVMVSYTQYGKGPTKVCHHMVLVTGQYIANRDYANAVLDLLGKGEGVRYVGD